MVYLYNNKQLEINDIVIAKVVEINNLNIVAKLPDYNDMTGYISYIEVARKRRYNLNKLVSIDKEIVTAITGINKEKNYVELSIRVVTPAEIEKFIINRKSYLNLYNLWRYVYMKLNPKVNMDITQINELALGNFMSSTLWAIETNCTEFENHDQLYNDIINPKTNLNILQYMENQLDGSYIISESNTSNETQTQIQTQTQIKTQTQTQTEIKKILDEYSQLKTIVKMTKDTEFTMTSYEITGCTDIINTLDYKSFAAYVNMYLNYDIGIMYISDSVYKLCIKQKKNLATEINLINPLMPITIDMVYNDIISEIKNRAVLHNINFNIQI